MNAATRSRTPSTWVGALNELESDVIQLEERLDENGEAVFMEIEAPAPWSPPQDLGPLPEDLRVRAVQVLQRQLAAAESLVEQITKSKQQRDVAARMSQTPTRPAAAFFDQAL